jgi:tetratricopeptide (TPR) repeat protein
LRSFHVIGRGSSFALRHMADNPVGLGRALNLAYAVTGRAMRRADRFRLHVDLLDCRDGRLIWSDAFDMAAQDVMRAADQLPDPIVAAIASEITLTERHRAAVAPENSPPDAWRSFHTGLNFLFQNGDTVLNLALHQFAVATSLDAGFARAHAFASFCHYNFAIRSLGADRATFVQAAFAASSQAVQQDDGSPAAHWAHGRALWLNRHPQAGLQQVRHAIAICPSFPHAHYMAGFIEAHQGDATRALLDLDKAQSLSPHDPFFLESLQVAKATALARTGQHVAAMALAAQAASHCAEFDQLQAHAALILAGLGDVRTARTIMDKAPKDEPAFRTDMLYALIYDMPDDIRRILQTGAGELGLSQG